MIDLHSHILPQMDDGSRSVDESLQMLAALAAQGVTDVAATPHFYASENSPERFLARRRHAWQRLAPHLTASLPAVHLGAEVLFFEGIAGYDKLTQLCLTGTDALLLEMPFRPWSRRMSKPPCRVNTCTSGPNFSFCRSLSDAVLVAGPMPT